MSRKATGMSVDGYEELGARIPLGKDGNLPHLVLWRTDWLESEGDHSTLMRREMRGRFVDGTGEECSPHQATV